MGNKNNKTEHPEINAFMTKKSIKKDSDSCNIILELPISKILGSRADSIAIWDLNNSELKKIKSKGNGIFQLLKSEYIVYTWVELIFIIKLSQIDDLNNYKKK